MQVDGKHLAPWKRVYASLGILGTGRLSVLCATLWSLIVFQPPPVFSQPQTIDPTSKVYKFINGQWFDGTSFQRQTFYTVDGKLTKKAPPRVDETINLASGYVVPPFTEAHNHNIGSSVYLNREFTKQMIGRYLAAGIFYVKIPAGDAEKTAILRSEFVNRPDSVDVTWANGVLTSRDGHPIGMTIDSFKQAGAAAPKISEFEGKSVFVIETEADLLGKWDKILAGKPDFIKTILCHSQNFAKRRETPALFGYNGLDPQLMPKIVQLAHKAGLRVSTHIYSSADFSAAVRAGVDEINHMPGIRFEEGTTEADYLIRPDDARRAAKQGTVVVATANVAKLYAKDEALAKVQAVQRKNLDLLKRHGVKVAVGSDNFLTTSVEEALYLNSLNVFSNVELLNMWTLTSAQTIFPNRRIGRLKDGYEASFVVLRNDPLADLNHVRDIVFGFKQGHIHKTAK